MPISETICDADDLHPLFIWCQMSILRMPWANYLLAPMFLFGHQILKIELPSRKPQAKIIVQ